MHALALVVAVLLAVQTTVPPVVKPIRLPGAAGDDDPAQRGRTVRVLFVGNSFTHGKWNPVLQYNRAAVVDENGTKPPGDPRAEPPNEPGPWGGIPGIVAALARESGLPYEVHLEAVSGKPLGYHLAHALDVIERPGWDVVVLQALSTEPLPEARNGRRADFVRDGAELERRIHAVNPQARVYVYATWPRADLVYGEQRPYSGASIGTMAADLREGVSALLRADPKFAGVAPAGDAWMRAIGAHLAEPDPFHPIAGELDLWGQDANHPSVYGAYLNALVLLGKIGSRDPRKFGGGDAVARDLEIAPRDAAALQRTAAESLAGR